MKLKLVFLDIDGVLNSRDWFTRRSKDNARSSLGDIDPDAASRVQRLCDETGASIVVSSTWRLLHKRLSLCDMFLAKGLTARVLGVTPHLPTKDRGDEIQLWLDRTPKDRGWAVEGMVILDDDQDMVHLTPWLVRTPFETGFVDAHMLDAKCVMAQAMPSPGTQEKI